MVDFLLAVFDTVASRPAALFFIVIAMYLIVVPCRYDPAIRLKERLDKRKDKRK
jgi:hypothetical protein